MASFVVDEDLHVAFAQERNATLITADLDFSNILDYPLGAHGGIIVLRIPDTLPYTVHVDRILQVVESMPDLAGSLMIVELTGERIRRPS